MASHVVKNLLSQKCTVHGCRDSEHVGCLLLDVEMSGISVFAVKQVTLKLMVLKSVSL